MPPASYTLPTCRGSAPVRRRGPPAFGRVPRPAVQPGSGWCGTTPRPARSATCRSAKARARRASAASVSRWAFTRLSAREKTCFLADSPRSAWGSVGARRGSALPRRTRAVCRIRPRARSRRARSQRASSSTSSPGREARTGWYSGPRAPAHPRPGDRVPISARGPWALPSRHPVGTADPSSAAGPNVITGPSASGAPVRSPNEQAPGPERPSSPYLAEPHGFVGTGPKLR